MLTTRCNTPTRHWLLLLSLLFRKILVVPMAALIPHFQTSKRLSEFDYSTKTLSAYEFCLIGRRRIRPEMDGDQLSVDCPGVDCRDPCGLICVTCPMPERSATAQLERRERRLQRPRRSVGTIHVSTLRWASLSKQATCIIILDYSTKVCDNSHVARRYQHSCRTLAFRLPPLKSCVSSILSDKDIRPTNLSSALRDS